MILGLNGLLLNGLLVFILLFVLFLLVYKFFWEFDNDSDEDFECDGCGKKFRWYRNTTVKYECVPDCELNGEKHIFPDFGEVIEKHDRDGFFRCRRCVNCNKFDNKEELR